MTTQRPLILKAALSNVGHARPLKDGRVAPEGIAFDHVEVEPIIAAFRRMVRATEFDVCEMSPTTYLTARAFNKPFTAIPVFLQRMFHDNALVYNVKSGIEHAKDFEGRRVGVRAYTVATGVWVRGLLQSDYGVDITRVTWFTDDEEHVTEWAPPANVRKTPEGKSLISMILAGELDASLTGAAGVGRAGAPTAGWEAGAGATPRVEDSPDIAPLLPDTGVVEVERFKRNGVYPIHGVIVVKDSVLQAHPWVARSLFDAFKAAKAIYLEQLTRDGPQNAQDQTALKRQAVVGPDHLPFGVEANRSSLEYLVQHAYDQQLTPRKFSVEEMFATGTLDFA